MLKYTIQRVLFMLLTLFIIIGMCFMLIRLLPPATLDPTDIHWETIEARREAMGYNKPLLVQFGIFLRDVFTKWDWGVSDKLYVGREVFSIFAEKMPATIIVNLYSIILSIPIGILLGIFAALKKNTWIDHTISTLTMVVISVPSFVYAFVIQYIFSYKLGWLPFVMESGTDYFTWKMFISMLPAVMSLSFGVIAGFARTTRAELTEVLTSEFMLLARTKGLTKAQATIRHALKNCMVVILPSIFGQFIGIMSGSLIIEKIFSIPGVGQLYIKSINAPDYPMFIMNTAFYTTIGLVASIVVDISYGLIDPRIRMGSKK
ncbi:MAG: ABC transporter permease [Clostridia bacterium]|nr:ABC transporter permease [Clostridia bacterium]